MRTLRVDDEDARDAASKALRAGEVVLVPTDTVYGLAAMPDRPEAVQRIYLAKNRPAHLPLPVLAASLDQIPRRGDGPVGPVVARPLDHGLRSFDKRAATTVAQRKR